ncbi:MAG: T9SS type A sorting domain-containing protein, partial [Crocinitomicaceae bacterium]|nr:T9SS type A sorting domain-containing protein [Crocinitomicaceae bacterium]
TNTGGVNLGHGSVNISWGSALATSFESGIGSGNEFPVGTSTESFLVVNGFGDSAWCSFNVIVVDSIVPTIIAPANVTTCDIIVNGISATSSDNCSGEMITYNMTGATTGSGSGDVSGMTFNAGTTIVWYIVTDASGNQDSVSFNVIVPPLPVVTIDAFTNNTVCVYHTALALPNGTPAAGAHSGPGVGGGVFDPAIAGVGSHWIVYTYINAEECSESDSTEIIVDGCAGIEEIPELAGFNVYPNPSEGVFNVEFVNAASELFKIEITDVNGRLIYTVSTQSEMVELGIDISEEARGVYFMNISSDSHSVVQRIVKN